MELEFIDENYSDILLTEYLRKNTPTKWEDFFTMESEKLITISEELEEYSEDKVIYPPKERIFNIFYQVPLSEIKVVILGQDPYHNGSAIGQAFAVLKGNKINPSLNNIYKEVINCGFKVSDKSGDLSKWVNQGVFLYNTALTVIKGEANSHSKIWEKFSIDFIKYITLNKEGIVFLLWGAYAQKLEKHIENRSKVDFKSKHKVIKTPHPSPLAQGFIGSKCFERVNNILSSNGGIKIDWSL